MKSEEERYREVCTILVSLLLSRRGSVAVATLDQDYYDIEGKPIPWRKFGYATLVEFLQNAQQHFEVYSENGTYYVKGNPSEKTKHIKRLVNQQKSNSKNYSGRSFHYVSAYNRHVSQKRPPVRVPFRQLLNLIQYINNYPNGVHIRTAVEYVKRLMPKITLFPRHLREQLSELSHKVHLDGPMIYPAQIANTSQRAKTNRHHRISRTGPRSTSWHVRPAHKKKPERDFSNNDGTPADYTKNHRPRLSITGEQRLSRDSRQERSSLTNSKNVDMKTNGSDDQVDAIINDNIKTRLQQLMQKYSDGLTCDELPNKFLDEYRVHLNYTYLGFSSVRQFASYLPQIFYMKPLDKSGNFLLLSADKKPTIPDGGSSDTNQGESKRDPPRQSDNRRNNAGKQSALDNPCNVADRRVFDVLRYNESVEQISVISLEKFGKRREVYIAEVFSPTFFWIHLREYNTHFVHLMNSINDFYNRKYVHYTVPKMKLKKDLNCVCMYEDRWHRGIIKNVGTDFKVKILFFDYGTVKTYLPGDICYLHRRFSYLPMQAICCGLSGIRPYDGDCWKKNVTVKFCDQVLGYLLDATIASIDSLHNSIMIELTNIREEENVRVNDWLVKEEVARYGEPIETCGVLSYYGECDVCDKSSVELSISKSVETSDTVEPPDAESTVSRLSDVGSDDTEKKSARALCNVSSNEKLLRMLRNQHNSRDIESRLESSLENEEKPLEKPTKSATLLKKLRAINITCSSSSNSSVSTPQTNEGYARNAQQIDSDKSTRTGPGHLRNRKGNCRNEVFECRNSDEDEFNGVTNNFGTLQSMYGGRGLMQPCDWSETDENAPSREETKENKSLKDLYNIMKRHSSKK